MSMDEILSLFLKKSLIAPLYLYWLSVVHPSEYMEVTKYWASDSP